MTSAPDRRTIPAAQIHKKKYFGASRTWDVWNKLTARDVFALTQMPHFEGIVKLFAHIFLPSPPFVLSQCKHAKC
jgi:hypothetical protein